MTQALAVSIVVVLGLLMGLVPLPQATVGLGSGKEVAKVAEQVAEQVAEVPPGWAAKLQSTRRRESRG